MIALSHSTFPRVPTHTALTTVSTVWERSLGGHPRMHGPWLWQRKWLCRYHGSGFRQPTRLTNHNRLTAGRLGLLNDFRKVDHQFFTVLVFD